MAENSEEETRMMACCTALLAAVLCAVAEEADHPDDTHHAQQEVFRRRSGFGMGPVSGEDMQLACEAVVQSMRSIHSMLSGTAQHGEHNALRHRESIEEVLEDYEALLESAGKLLVLCPAFGVAVRECEWAVQMASNANISPLAPDYDQQLLNLAKIRN